MTTIPHYTYFLELECAMCGRSRDDVESDVAHPPLVFLPRDKTRCENCGGRAVLTGEFTRKLILEADGAIPPPKRGGPTIREAYARRQANVGEIDP